MARNYAREYAQRKARAAEAGSTVGRMRKMGSERRAQLRANAGQRANVAKQRAAERRAAEARADEASRDVDDESESISSRNMGTIRAAVARAARADRKITAVVTCRIDDGNAAVPLSRKPLRDFTLWGDGGWDASQFMANVRAMGTRAAFLDQVRKLVAQLKYPVKVLAVVHVDLTAFE